MSNRKSKKSKITRNGHQVHRKPGRGYSSRSNHSRNRPSYRSGRKIIGSWTPSWGGTSISLTDRLSIVKPKHIPLRKNFEITPEAFAQITNTVGSEKCESGGILLGSREDFVVRKYVHDPFGTRSGGAYDPDVNFLNEVVEKAWNEEGLAFLGFVHSHPRGVGRLSGDMGNGIGDLGYIARIMEHMPGLESFLCPIVYSQFDGGPFSFHPFIADRGAVSEYYSGNLQLIPNSLLNPVIPPIPEDILEPEPEMDARIINQEPIIEDETEPETSESVDDEGVAESEEEETDSTPDAEADPSESEDGDETSESWQEEFTEDVEQQLENGTFSYEEKPPTILKPINNPVLTPEEDPSVA